MVDGIPSQTKKFELIHQRIGDNFFVKHKTILTLDYGLYLTSKAIFRCFIFLGLFKQKFDLLKAN